MSQHVDILDAPEPLGRSFVGALVLHVAVAGVVIGAGVVGQRTVVQWGDPLGGGPGSVSVNVVNKIPLPTRSGMVNPLANDTESVVPEPKPKAKPSPQVKEPEPDAIPIKSRNAQKRAAQAASANKWRAQQQDRPNQVYSSAGQAVVSPMYGHTGGGGIGIGNNSPFGQEFGWFVNLLRDQVARNWKTSDVDPRLQTAPPVVVSFTIRRDGSLAPGSVRILQRSGNYALDASAQRAVYDAAPFRALPPGFTRNEANIEFWFQLRR
jgi:periplasmic protein TonB